ncbi:MAG: hypothetical protein LBE37_01325 [Sphingobacterium sp.]|jgi:hypothetical protein|nr:hypothetical protein [Sphingobacterium sp.]
MKKLILTGLSFLFAVTILFAQEINPENKAKETVTELTEKLTLTEDQQTAVYNIVLEKVNAKIAVKSDTTLSAEVVKEQIQALKATANGKINDLLTDEQKTLFIKYLEEKMANKKE